MYAIKQLRSLRWAAVCIISGILLTIVIEYVFRLDPLHISSPSDRYLISYFNDNRIKFEDIVQSYASLPNHGITTPSSITQNENRLRTPKYRTASIPSVLTVGVDGEGIARFVFAEGKILAVGADWAKGLEYVPGVDGQQTTNKDSLDETYRLPPGIYLRQIEPHWFIFYQKDE